MNDARAIPGFRNILFDLDGTLTDPIEGFAASVNHALVGLGMSPVSVDHLKQFVGPPLEETMRRLVGDSPEGIREAISLYRERYGRIGFLENSVYPGIKEIIEALDGRGASLYLATSKPVVFAERILNHFGLADHFRGIYGSQLDGTHANKKHLIRHVLDSETLAASSAVMIGDRMHDVVGASANGLRTVGVLWGYGSRTELQDAGAASLCEAPSDLPSVLSALEHF